MRLLNLFDWFVNPHPFQTDPLPTRGLLLECALLVHNRKVEIGPLSWFASVEEAEQTFHVQVLFHNQEAVAFHKENIHPILKKVNALTITPPVTTVREVFLSA